MGGWIRRLGDDLEEQRDLGSRRRVPLLGCPVHRRQLSILRGFVSSCGPTAPTPSRGMNASHKGTQTRRREAEGRLRFDCFFNRLSRRLGSADYTDGRRLVPGGSMAESASIPKSADERDWGLAKLLRRRLIFLAIWRGMLRHARIDA